MEQPTNQGGGSLSADPVASIISHGSAEALPSKLVSLCAIVGNVEDYIERFLRSFAPIADSIVLVRAIGNQKADKTLDIAAAVCSELGIPLVSCDYLNKSENGLWPHVDNFAAARQMSFDLATGKYLFWADTDDVLKEGAAEVIRELAERAHFPYYILPYEIFGRGVTVPRERLIAKDAPGRWKFPVHESFQFDFPVPAGTDARAVVQHLPKPSKSGSVERNLRILESIPKEEITPGLLYHLHQEYKGAGMLRKAVESAQAALARPDIGTPEKYELLCDLARACKPESGADGQEVDTRLRTSAAYLLQAYGADPCRREALGLLSGVMIDLGQPKQALAYARAMMALPLPQDWSWNDRQGAYGWIGWDVFQQALRCNGLFEEADKVRHSLLLQAEKNAPVISLLHATRGRPRQASIARKKWLDLAEIPERVEHIFAIDADDESSHVLTRFHTVVVDGTGGCVDAWNTAAGNCVGKVMVQVSDDWTPPAKWDSVIVERLRGGQRSEVGDGLELPLVLAVSDGHRTDALLCMAICTRAYFVQDWFLFHPWFTGVFSDNWFTQQAYGRGQVVEAKDLVFEHEHPAFNPEVPSDDTYERQNAPERYVEGQKTWTQLQHRTDWSTVPGFFNFWPWYQQVARRLQDGDTFVEVGVWLGRSIVYLAQELQRMGKTGVTLVAVDLFRGEMNQPAHTATVEANGGHMRAAFEEHLERCGVRSMVDIVEADSAAAADAFDDGTLAGVFIDAAHDYESVRRDVSAWLPKVRKDGIVSGHDAHYEPVMRAVLEQITGAQRVGCIWTRSLLP